VQRLCQLDEGVSLSNDGPNLMESDSPIEGLEIIAAANLD
jgi:hypothetical protein